MTMWITEEEKANLEKMQHSIYRKLFFSTEEEINIRKNRRELKEDNRKWAYIVVGKTRKMCFVDNKTMKAYKADGYNSTWIEIKEFSFERWCTGHDL